MMTELNVPIIGYMNSPYREKFGIPRQPNLVQVESYIEMVEPYNDLLAFEGIDEFSHLWLIWQFHDNKNQQDSHKFRPQVRPPRLGGNKKIGVFATRSMYRPAPMGLSVVQLKEVKKVGKSVRVYVTGSDLLSTRMKKAVIRFCWSEHLTMRIKTRSCSATQRRINSATFPSLSLRNSIQTAQVTASRKQMAMHLLETSGLPSLLAICRSPNIKPFRIKWGKSGPILKAASLLS